MNDWYKKNRSFLTHPFVLLLSGALVGLTTVLPYTFLLLLALAPFLILVIQEYTYREIAKGSLLFGIGFFSIAYLWVWGVYPMEWIGIADWRISFALVLFFWVFTSISLSTTMVARAIAMRFLILRYAKITPLIVSSVWVIFEYLAALSVSLVWAGNQGVIGAHWAFGFLGYSLAEIPIIRSLSAVGGIYSLGFFAALIVSLLFCFLMVRANKQEYDFKNSFFVVGLLLLGALLWFGLSYSDSSAESKTVALIHTAYPSKLQRTTLQESELRALDIFEELEKRVDEGLSPDIVLFPEGSAVLNQIPKERIQALFQKLSLSSNTLLLNPSNNNNLEKDLISSVWYVRVRTGIIETRNKEFLVPVGEYKPYFADFFSGFSIIGDWLESTYKYHGYTKVPEREVVFKEDEVGVLQCSEILSPVFYRTLAEDHKVLANAASHAPFTRPFLIRHQTLKMARIHALANDRFFVQSGNIAPAYVVTNRGSIQSFLNTSDTQILADTVLLRDSVTPYTRWGDWFVFMLLLGIALLMVPMLYRK